MAKALMASYMEPYFRQRYCDAESSRKMWGGIHKDQKESGAEHFHHINDDFVSLNITDFPPVTGFNEKFKSLLCHLTLCDVDINWISDIEAAYIILRSLLTDDEPRRMFHLIHSSATKL
ncbi:hypothetical protein L873DRAFT_1787496 [Choiromyces venosus 120613-1]|uniref:Uncharacterized protein n=1 Tax=Choiromyces venosus 120613-1 TaxID=1336337 RepID=A0A3N4K338_9PEZI|nr:hypothetical protein L873DRAFT_1787496 [Choiromyces venosus 120613-1]